MSAPFETGLRAWAGMAIAQLAVTAAFAQERALPSVTVTADRVEQRLFDTPAADGVTLDWKREPTASNSISEALAEVPGVAVRERRNYAQDVQLAIRGFGSRASFGIRGSRLLVDGIPASMPDGQGQASTVSMASARRVEVLRGPWAQMYGNVGGGVMLVETTPPPAETQAGMRAAIGSDGFRQAMGQAGGTVTPGFGVQAGASVFSTDGEREHAAARRRYLDLRLDWQGREDTKLRVGISGFSQPKGEDPSGLTKAEFERDPRAASPAARQFDARKEVDQFQAGAYGERRIGRLDRVAGSAYAGRRELRQFLAFSGAAAASAGGVVDLERSYYGGALAWHRDFDSADRIPVRWSIGGEVEAMRDRRLGFVNAGGSAGSLRRDEDNDATASGAYAKADAYVHPQLMLSAGARYSHVAMRAEDRYINASSPDDSGRVTYRRFSPVAGVLWHASEEVNLFANLGLGFETPTFTELAYRPVGSGLNFALRPARSRHSEAGVKTKRGGASWQATLFHSMTDGEIVPLSNQGGRTAYRNVDGVERYGLEMGAKGEWRAIEWTAAYTLLQARFTQGFVSADGRPVNAGNRLPGTARHSIHLEASWEPHEAWRLGASLHAESRIMADDINSEAAPGYAALGLEAERRFRLGRTDASAFLRVENLLDRSYSGSVIVNEANRRFYEPAGGRTLLAAVRFTLE